MTEEASVLRGRGRVRGIEALLVTNLAWHWQCCQRWPHELPVLGGTRQPRAVAWWFCTCCQYH